MKHVQIAVDGASRGNPGASGIGVVIYDEDGNVLKEIGEFIGRTTNNVAEYTAMIRGLEESLKLGAKTIDVQTDSELLAKQVTGIYRIKAPHLAELYHRVRGLFAKFDETRIIHARRELNVHADRLASDAARRKADYVPEKAPKAVRKARPVELKPASRSVKPQPEPPRQSGGGQMSFDIEG